MITTSAPASVVPVIVGVLSEVISSLSLVPVSEDAAKSAVVVSTLVSLLIVSVDVAVFPAVSVEVTLTVKSPSLKDDKSTLSTEYEPSALIVISAGSTVTVFVPSVIVKLSIDEPASTVPAISLVATSSALITLSPDSSVISVVFEVVVSTVIVWVVVAVFPAVSVDVIVKSCVPSESSLVVIS